MSERFVAIQEPQSIGIDHFTQDVQYTEAKLLQAFRDAYEIFNVTQDVSHLNSVLAAMGRKIGCDTCSLHKDKDVIVGAVESREMSGTNVALEGHCGGVSSFHPDTQIDSTDIEPIAIFRGTRDDNRHNEKGKNEVGNCGLNPVASFKKLQRK